MGLHATAIRVLLVDDHATLLWGLERLIESARPAMEVVGTARDCQEALEQAAALAPDVILLDLDLGGKSAVGIIPQLSARAHARILVLTASGEQALLDAAIRNGARGLLRKDAPAEQVIRAIGKVHQGEIWLEQAMLGRVLDAVLNPATRRLADADSSRAATLTEKERKVIHAVVEQCCAANKVIAARLFISEHTLRNHLTSIYQKLGVGNRLELYFYAVKHHIGIRPPSPHSPASPE